MTHHPAWRRQAAPPARAKPTSPIACILFVLAMGAAFWIGTIWASQAWWPQGF